MSTEPWLPDVREYWPDGCCTRCSEPHADDRRGLCDACMWPDTGAAENAL